MEETRRFADELQHRRYTLRVLMESAAQAIIAANSDGQIVLCNQMAYRMFGYEPGELVGEPLDILIPDGARPGHDAYRRSFHANPTGRPMGSGLNPQGRRKDGGTFPVEVFLNYIDTSGGMLGVAFVSDITERKNAEEALRRREEQYRSLFDNMNEAVVYCEMVYDDNGKGTDFVYRMVNPRFEKMTGRTDVIGKRISELVPGIRERDPQWFEIHARVATTRVPEKFEIFLNSLQQWYSMSVYSPEKGFCVAIFDNITERKQTEESLRRSEERLRLAVEGTGAGSFDFHVKTGEHVWSDVTRHHFGLPAGAEVSDAAFRESVHPEDRARRLRAVATAMRRGSSGEYVTEYRVKGIADGKERWVSVRGKVLFDAEGRPERVLGLTRDLTKQKRDEEALRESEERLRLAVEGVKLGTIEWNMRTGRRVWSELAKSYFGLPPDAAVDDTTLERGIHPDDRELHRLALEGAMAPGGNGEYRAIFRTIGIQDGKERWISARGKIYFDGAGRPERRLAVISDVTERRRKEVALRESEERLRLAVEGTGAGTFDFDLRTRKHVWSDVIRGHFGVPPDGTLDETSFEDAIHPDDRAGRLAAIERATQPGGSGEYASEFRLRGIADGKERWILGRGKVSFDRDGRPVRILGLTRDLTERKRAEEALRESEERLRLAVEGTGAGTFDHDLRTDRRVWSDATKEHFGLSPGAEVTEGVVRGAIHPDDRERVLRMVDEAARPGGDGQFAAEYRTIGVEDGRERWLSARGRIFCDSEGRPARIVGLTRDLTAGKRAAAALHESEERLRVTIDATRVGTFDFDPRTKKRIWSDVAKSFFGLAPEAEVDEETVWRGLHPDDRDRVMERIRENIERPPEDGYSLEFRTIGIGDGKERWIAVRGQVLRDSEGRAERFLGVMQDVTEQKQGELWLRDSEERLRLAVECAGLGTIELDLNTGKRTWSALAKKCFGLPADAAVEETTFLNALHPEDRERVAQKLAETMRPGGDGDHATEFRAVGIGDGIERWVFIRGKVYFNEQGRAVRRLGVMQDITERKLAEEALRESEGRLRLAVECAELGTIEIDLRTGKRKWSDLAKQYFGLTPDAEVDGTTFRKGVHPDDWERVHASLEEAMRPESGGEHWLEFRAVGIGDGIERWLFIRRRVFFDRQGRPVRRLGVMQDITERKRAEEALRESEERLRLAVEAAGLGMFEIDARTGKRTYSEVKKSYFGLPSEAEVDQTTFEKALPPDDRERMLRMVAEALGPESKGLYGAEYRTADGRWLATWAQTLRDKDGRPERFVGMTQDLTARKRMEEALRESEERLRLAVECGGLGTVEIDLRTGKRKWSALQKSFFGLPADAEVDEATFGKRLHPEDRERVLRLLQELTGPDGPGKCATEFRTAEGRWLAAWGQVMHDRQGRPDRFMGMMQDLTEQKLMEEALRNREQEVSAVLNDTPDWIVRLDREYRYTYVNARFAAAMGKSQEECIGKTAVEAGLPKELVEEWRPMSRRAFETGETGGSEFICATEDGPAEWEQRLIPEFGPDGRVKTLLVIARNVTEQKRLERIVEKNRDEIRALAASLLTAQEEERRRVSYELHDEICQDLANLAFEIGGLAVNPPARKDAPLVFRTLQARVVKATEEARHISYRLHPSMLDDLGLVVSLRTLCKEFRTQTGIAVEFTDSGLPGTVPREVASCVYRVAQQSLQNIANHAAATTVSAAVTWREGRVTLIVSDDGVGFEEEAVQGKGGLGLIGMKERARMVNGKLTVAAERGRGTRIELEIPLAEGDRLMEQNGEAAAEFRDANGLGDIAGKAGGQG